MSDLAKRLEDKIRTGEARLGTLGLGLRRPARSPSSSRPAGLRVTGFDLSAEKVAAVNRGESYIKDVPAERRQGARGREGACAPAATSTAWPSATR